MTFIINKKDPIKENIDYLLGQWSYGENKHDVRIQLYNFVVQYPQFELSAENFKYNHERSKSKVVYLRGAMVLTIDYDEHAIPVHFVLINGFPKIAPKAFLTMENNEEIINDNPFVLK